MQVRAAEGEEDNSQFPSRTMPQSRWRLALLAWRGSKPSETGSESFLNRREGSTFLASKLDEIEVLRSEHTGTQHTHLSEQEFDEQFFLREVLGQGGFGVVHRAIRLQDAKALAIKVIDSDGSEKIRKDALFECKLWQAISSPYHPSILPLLEVIEVSGSGTLHLVTELMPFGVLREVLRDFEDGLMCEQSIRLVMIQIVSAVAHLHCVHSIAHRDIKPENVLCEGPDPTMVGSLKLCDFGACRRFTSLTEPAFDDPIGTASYFSPELAAAFIATDAIKYAGAPADCWALGAVCYELMHGVPPSHVSSSPTGAKTKEDMLARLASDHVLSNAHPVAYPVETFEEFGADANDFVRRLLTGSPLERASVQEALDHAWLQPMSHEAWRSQMVAVAPKDVVVRRARAAEKLRAAGQKIVFANRLIRRHDGGGEDDAPTIAFHGESASSISSSFRKPRSKGAAAAAVESIQGIVGSFKKGNRRAKAILERHAAREESRRKPTGDDTGVDNKRGGRSRSRRNAHEGTGGPEEDAATVDFDPIVAYADACSPGKVQGAKSPPSATAVLDAAFAASPGDVVVLS